MRMSKVLGLVGFTGMLLAGRVAGAQGQDEGGAYSMGAQGRMVRGTVTAVATDRLTVKTEEGEVFQVLTTTNTRLMKERQPVKLADVHVGDGVGAMGVVDAPTKTVHAAMVMVVDAARVKELREDLGKKYISGRVMAIEELELTIKRQDGVTQKIAVDEGTSFKRGRRGSGAMMRGDGSGAPGPGSGAGAGGPGGAGAESITLADVKVGDMVVGPGGLKAGVFVPTELTVMDAGSMGRRARGEGAPGTAPAPAGTGGH